MKFFVVIATAVAALAAMADESASSESLKSLLQESLQSQTDPVVPLCAATEACRLQPPASADCVCASGSVCPPLSGLAVKSTCQRPGDTRSPTRQPTVRLVTSSPTRAPSVLCTLDGVCAAPGSSVKLCMCPSGQRCVPNGSVAEGGICVTL